MHEGKRPGGLTALAVFNFLGCANDLLGILAILVMVLLFPKLIDKMEEKQQEQEAVAEEPAEEVPDEERPTIKEDKQQEQALKQLNAWSEIGYGALALWCFLLVSCATLLLLSGIGYLKQKKFLGRRLGNTYALLSIGTSVFEVNVVPVQAGGGLPLLPILSDLDEEILDRIAEGEDPDLLTREW